MKSKIEDSEDIGEVGMNFFQDRTKCRISLLYNFVTGEELNGSEMLLEEGIL